MNGFSRGASPELETLHTRSADEPLPCEHRKNRRTRTVETRNGPLRATTGFQERGTKDDHHDQGPNVGVVARSTGKTGILVLYLTEVSFVPSSPGRIFATETRCSFGSDNPSVRYQTSISTPDDTLAFFSQVLSTRQPSSHGHSRCLVPASRAARRNIIPKTIDTLRATILMTCRLPATISVRNQYALALRGLLDDGICREHGVHCSAMG